MSDAIEITIADAIRDELEGHAFEITVDEIVRSYADINSEMRLIDGQLRIDVVPHFCEMLETRGTKSYRVETDIVIRRRFALSDQDIATGRPPNSLVDPLLRLRQDIGEFFAPNFAIAGHVGRSLANATDASFEAIEYSDDESFVAKDKQRNQFTCRLRVIYEAE